MATRLAIAVILISATAVAAASVIGLRSGERSAERLIEQRIVSIRGAERFQVSSYLESTRSTVSLVADGPMTAQALRRFSAGVDDLAIPDRAVVADWREQLLDHYSVTVAPELARTTGRAVSPAALVPANDAGLVLQRAFLPGVSGRHPIDVVEPDLEPDASDLGAPGTWATAHRELHPVFRNIAERLGADELSLIDPGGTVVYSVSKSIDFGTNLLVGPHSGRALSAAVRSVVADPAGVVAIDMSIYPPALGRPVWFLVAPVHDADELVGVLAVRFTVAALNELLVAGGDPASETGEVYLAGADAVLRSDPRAFVESAPDYLAAARDAGMSAEDADLVAARSTTALVQRTDSQVVADALAGRAGVEHRLDHLGREAVMAYVPLGVDHLDWVVIAQLSTAEARAPIEDYRRLLLVVATVIVAVVTFVAVSWAGRIVRPVRLMGDRLGDPRLDAGGGRGGQAYLPSTVRTDELARLADALDQMETQLVTRRAEVEQAHEERRAVLRSLVPPFIARRLDAGGGPVVERPEAASVVVVVLGRPPDAPDRSVAPRSDLDRALARLDEVAAVHGAERVKLVGDACFYATGHQQLLLDHARRALSFAAQARETFAAHREFSVAFGIATGPVNVGLAGSTQLVYDMWGRTVSEAYLLARRAAPGAVLLAAATKAHLPDDSPVTAFAGAPDEVWVLGSAVAGAERGRSS